MEKDLNTYFAQNNQFIMTFWIVQWMLVEIYLSLILRAHIAQLNRCDSVPVLYILKDGFRGIRS